MNGFGGKREPVNSLIRSIAVVLSFVFCGMCAAEQGEQERTFAVAVTATPVFNSPDIAGIFNRDNPGGPRADDAGLVRELEFVALPGSVFLVEEGQGEGNIVKVRTQEYPSNGKELFVDKRFIRVEAGEPEEREKKLPRRQEIQEHLKALEGTRYVWGGNVSKGVPKMKDLYEPPAGLEEKEADEWELRGVDCSGLLYEATAGSTPRNTEDLVSFGVPVAVKGLESEEIKEKLKPLDLIVWKGHVIVVLENGTVIESRLDNDKDMSGAQDGVVIRGLEERLREIMTERQPADGYTTEDGEKVFVVRRWYDTLARELIAGRKKKAREKLEKITADLRGATSTEEKARLMVEKAKQLIHISGRKAMVPATEGTINAISLAPYEDDYKRYLFLLYEYFWKNETGTERAGLKERVKSIVKAYNGNKNFELLMGPQEVKAFLGRMNESGISLSGGKKDKISAYSTEYGWFEIEDVYAYYEMYEVDIDNDGEKEKVLIADADTEDTLKIAGVYGEKDGKVLEKWNKKEKNKMEELLTTSAGKVYNKKNVPPLSVEDIEICTDNGKTFFSIVAAPFWEDRQELGDGKVAMDILWENGSLRRKDE